MNFLGKYQIIQQDLLVIDSALKSAMVCEVEASLLAESRVRGCKYSGFGPLCSQIPLTEGIKGRPGGELVWTLLRQHDPRDLSPVYPSRGMKNEFPSIQIF